MADRHFFLVKGDTLPALEVTLTDPTGGVIDLLGCQVTLFMKFAQPVEGGEVIINHKPATVIDSPNGVVQYSWQPTDTARAGLFYARFRIIYPSSRQLHFPNKQHGFLVQISEA